MLWKQINREGLYKTAETSTKSLYIKYNQGSIDPFDNANIKQTSFDYIYH